MPNLLSGAGRQELEVIALVSRNTPRQEDGIDSSVFLDELADILFLVIRNCVGWAPFCIPVYPSLKARELVVVLEGLETPLACYKVQRSEVSSYN